MKKPCSTIISRWLFTRELEKSKARPISSVILLIYYVNMDYASAVSYYVAAEELYLISKKRNMRRIVPKKHR